MNLLSPHPTPRRHHQHGKRKIVTLLLGGGLLWVSALFFLFPLLATRLAAHLPRLVAGSAALQTIAGVATSLLELILAATLIAQMRGSRVPSWAFLLPALLLLVSLWWV